VAATCFCTKPCAHARWLFALGYKGLPPGGHSGVVACVNEVIAVMLC
jgi:hypothetical protein